MNTRQAELPARSQSVRRLDVPATVALQRSAGNAALARVLSRCPDGSDPACPCAHEPSADDGTLERELASAARRRAAPPVESDTDLLALGSSGPGASCPRSPLNAATPVGDAPLDPRLRSRSVEQARPAQASAVARSVVPRRRGGPNSLQRQADEWTSGAGGGWSSGATESFAVAGPTAEGVGSDVASSAEAAFASSAEEPAGLDAPGPAAASAAPGCGYGPGEKSRTATHPGGGARPAPPTTDPITGESAEPAAPSFDIFGFTQGSADLKAAHVEFLAEMVRSFRLDTPNPTHRVILIEGFTDCVDGFAINVGIRLRRADAARAGLLSQGALEQNLGSAAASPDGATIASNDTEDGRTRNRAAVCHLERLRERPDDSPSDPTLPSDTSCDQTSHLWKIQGISQISGAAVVFGGTVITFDVTSQRTGCVHRGSFVAGGLAFPPGISVSASLPSDPETHFTDDVFARELNGNGVVTAAEGGFAGPSVQAGELILVDGALEGQAISLSGPQQSTSPPPAKPKRGDDALKKKPSFGVAVLAGRFTVDADGR